MKTMNTPTLRKDPDRPGTLTDGVHTFFACSWTSRVRWARSASSTDGLGLPAHGAADNLEDAQRAAHEADVFRAGAR